MKTRTNILGMEVNLISERQTLNIIKQWTMPMIPSENRNAHYICVSNVHMCMETFDDGEFRTLVNQADIVLPDGRPLVWAQYLIGNKSAKQVRGSDIMLSLCKFAADNAIPIGLYGGDTKLLHDFSAILRERFPPILIACKIAPPFRPLTEEEDQAYVDEINASGARLLFVGIGCPKQERWMAEHKTRLHCVMIGVGAAFDFLTGRKRHAPRWMQKVGLEWLFRLFNEPRRLWKRYLKHNPRFVWYFARQWLASPRDLPRKTNV